MTPFGPPRDKAQSDSLPDDFVKMFIEVIKRDPILGITRDPIPQASQLRSKLAEELIRSKLVPSHFLATVTNPNSPSTLRVTAFVCQVVRFQEASRPRAISRVSPSVSAHTRADCTGFRRTTAIGQCVRPYTGGLLTGGSHE